MISFSKPKKTELPSTITSNVFDQALDSVDNEQIPVGNFTSVANDQSFAELFELAGIAQEKGLKGQVKHIGRRIIATALERQGFSLLATREDKRGDVDITRINADGSKNYLRSPGQDGEWRRMRLQGYDMHLPDSILRDIPGEIVKNAQVFVPKFEESFFIDKDPIIAVHLHQAQEMDREHWVPSLDFYIGLYVWD